MNRWDFIKSTSLVAIGASGLTLQDLHAFTSSFGESPLMPAIFIGHGTPMNALNDNAFTQSLTKLGKGLPRPNAIAVVSAHWLTDKTYVSVNPAPKTIYDFGGFPEALYKVKYEPKGHPELAKEVMGLAEGVAYDWAIEFDRIVKDHLDKGDFMSLVNYHKFGKAAQMSIPTHDHYTPMLYALGLSDKNEHIKYFHEGLELGSISMRSFIIS